MGGGIRRESGGGIRREWYGGIRKKWGGGIKGVVRWHNTKKEGGGGIRWEYVSMYLGRLYCYICSKCENAQLKA